MPLARLSHRQPSIASLSDGGGRTSASRLREKKFLDDFAPALINHCMDQQEAMGSLIEVTTRAQTEMHAVRKAIHQMERRLNMYMEMSNRKLPGDEKDNEQPWAQHPAPPQQLGTKPVEVFNTIAASACESSRSEGSPGPLWSHGPQIRQHETFNYVVGDSLGRAEEPAPSSKKRNRSRSVATLQAGSKLNFAYEDKQDIPRVHFNVGLFGWTKPFYEVLDAVALIAVAFNSGFTWFQANKEMDNRYLGTPIEHWVDVIDVLFTVVFTFELALRMWVFGPKVFFTGKDKVWNIMDCFFVSSSLVALVEWTAADLCFIRTMRIARVMKAFRAVRGMRFIRELRLMLASIMASLASFIWGAFLAGFIMYVFALCLMQSLVIADSSITAEMYDLYGSVFTSMITLFMAVSGGRDWADLYQPLDDVNHLYLYFYTFYISIVVFFIMNVLTALFCENTSHIAGVDRGLVIQDEIDRVTEDHAQIKRCFIHADGDGDGKLGLDELEAFLDDPGRRAFLSLLSIDATEARGLFELMDSEKDNKVDINDYVDAIMRLRGAAKGCDAAMLMYENKRMMIRMGSLMCFVCDNFNTIRAKLDADAPALSLENYLNQGFLEEKEAQAKQLVHKGLAAHLGQHAEGISAEPHATKLEQLEAMERSVSRAAHRAASWRSDSHSLET